MTRDLQALRQWLQEAGCTHVAMESTGIYWLPVYTVLEGAFELVIGNATHIKQVPGARPTSRTASGSPTCCDMA
jgi:hypothetical protein